MIAKIRGIKPFPVYQKQADFLEATEFIKGFCAGRGSGKSVIGAFEVLYRARAKESWMSVSPDSSVISDTTWPTFQDVAKQTGQWVRGIQSPYHKAWFWTLDGGRAEITFRSGERPEKLRGPSKAGLWLDEASVMVREVFEIALAVLRFKGRMGSCLMTFTPKGRQHWTFSEFFEPIEDDELEKLTEEDRDQLNVFGGAYYRLRDNRKLVQAHSAENPFLPEEYVDNIRDSYSEIFAAQELGGQFVDIAGLMFSRNDFVQLPWRDFPRDEALRVRYWDQAGTPGAGSYSCGMLMAKDNRGFWVEDIVRGQWSAYERRERMRQTAERDASRHDNSVVIYVEQEGGSGGKEQMQQTIMELAGHPVYRDIVSGQRWKKRDKLNLPGQGKIVRAMPASAQVEAHNVFLPREAPWLREFLDEIIAFPESAVTDQVDCFSGCINKLSGRGTRDPGSPTRVSRPTDSVGSQILELQREMRMKRGGRR